MSGGFLIALDGGLYRRVAAALVAMGGVTAMDDLDGEVVQYGDDEGRLFTLFETVPMGTEWEFREGPVIAGPGVQLPDMQSVTACPFECRWPDLAAGVADVASRTSDAAATWLLDGDGVVWNAGSVNTAEVRL